MVIMILAIIIPTVTRLALRLSKRQMEFGSDDWAIIAAAVSELLPILPSFYRDAYYCKLTMQLLH